MNAGSASETRSFAFDLSRAVAFDIECYRTAGAWGSTVRTATASSARSSWTAIPANSPQCSRRLADHGQTPGRVQLRAVRRPPDPRDSPRHRSARIRPGDHPRRTGWPRSLSGLPALQCDHIDLAARVRRGGGFPSLKLVAANLGRPKLRELPYPPDAVLTDEQWAEVKRYNSIDVAHTWALLERFSPELQALATLSQELSRDLRSTPTPRVCELVFLDAYRRMHGVEPKLPEPPREVLYRPVPRRLQADEAWRPLPGSIRSPNQPLPVVALGDRLKVNVPAGHLRDRRALGLRRGRRPGQRRSGPSPLLDPQVSARVGQRRQLLPEPHCHQGHRPSVIWGHRGDDLQVHPGTSAGDRGPGQSKAVQEPAERERLDVQANALKLILNSTFGKYGDSFSTLFDPGAMLAVTLSGQLMLIDLIERLSEAGVRILSANTDGLFIRVAAQRKTLAEDPARSGSRTPR